MPDDLEALLRRWRAIVLGNEVVGFFVHLIGVVAGLVTPTKPLSANLVRDVENMKLVRHARFRDDMPHPLSPTDGVCRKIEHNRDVVAKNINDMWRHCLAEAQRQSGKILDRPVFRWKQSGHPAIHGDQQGRGSCGQLACARRLAGSDFPADKIKRGSTGRFHRLMPSTPGQKAMSRRLRADHAEGAPNARGVRNGTVRPVCPSFLPGVLRSSSDARNS